MADNSAMSQFNVDTSQYTPTTSNPYDSGSDFWNGFGDFFTAGWLSTQRDKVNRANEANNAALANALEEARLNSARQYEAYMDSTKYQRAVADAKAAGINPYYLFSNSVNTSPGGTASAMSSQRAASQMTKHEKSSSSLISSAMKIIALMAIK